MSEYKKETDKVHKITLDSKIVHASWCSKIACVGSQVAFEVWMQFVGNGSDIEIKVEDKQGNVIENIKGKVYDDFFRNSMVISENAKEELTFTVKLPKHGLEKKSNRLRVIKVWNLKWGQKEARRGDIVTLSADIEGVPDETEIMIHIYEHDQDEAHDFITKFPCVVKNNKIEAEWKFEYHEDTDDIPTEEDMNQVERHYNHPEYFFVISANGCKAKSELLKFKDWIEINLRDAADNPIGDKEYIIHLPDGSEKRGMLDKDGFARLEDIPPGKVEIEIPGYKNMKLSNF